MSYIEIMPRRKEPENLNYVRISFIKRVNKKGKQTTMMIIYLGIKLLEKLNIRSNDKIKFHVNVTNKRMFKIEKSNDGIGFRLSKQHSGSRFYRTSFSWKVFIPTESEYGCKHQNYEIKEESIYINYQ